MPTKPKQMQLLLRFLMIALCLNQVSAQSNFNFHCPGNLTVNCNINYQNLDQFGKAYVDQGGIKIWIKECKINIELNDCGIGEISRSWEVQDPNFQWQTCKQIITLSNANAFGYADITWPRDITIESCDPETDLKNLMKPFDRPYWKTNKCAKPMLGFTDSRHKVTEGCIKLLRTWKILDWCVYDAYHNPNQGIFMYTQTIKLIKNDTAARIQCPNDTLITTFECEGLNLKLDAAKLISPCNMPFVIYNNSQHADTNLASGSGYYPIGDHKFHYIAEYACGKQLNCEYKISIKNIKQPTPYCKDGIIVDLMPIDNNGDGIPDEGMIEIWANDLDKGSFHSCKGRKLNFSFSSDIADRSKVFTCKELGENEITIYVTDEFGNQDFCKTKAIIQNNTGIPNCQKGNVKGKKFNYSLTLHNHEKHSAEVQAKVRLLQLKDQTISELTNLKNGIFEIKDLNLNEKYKLNVQVDEKFLSDFQDILWMKKFQKGEIKNANPMQWLAADLNSDQLVDMKDMNILISNRNNRSSNGYKIIPERLLKSNDILGDYDNEELSLEYKEEGTYTDNYIIVPMGRFQSSIKEEGTLNSSDEEDNFNLNSGIKLIQSQAGITIFNSTIQSQTLRIMNLIGQELMNQRIDSSSEISILFSNLNLNPGYYLVKINNSSRIIFIE